MEGRLETCGRLSIALPGGGPNEKEARNSICPDPDRPRRRLVARLRTARATPRDSHARKCALLPRGLRFLPPATRVERVQGQVRLARQRKSRSLLPLEPFQQALRPARRIQY